MRPCGSAERRDAHRSREIANRSLIGAIVRAIQFDVIPRGGVLFIQMRDDQRIGPPVDVACGEPPTEIARRRGDRSPPPSRCAGPLDASPRCRHSPARARDHLLVVNAARSVHRPRLCRPGPRPQPPLNPSFAPRHVLVSTCLHSKCPPRDRVFGVVADTLCDEVRTFRTFRLHADLQTRLYWDQGFLLTTRPGGGDRSNLNQIQQQRAG